MIYTSPSITMLSQTANPIPMTIYDLLVKGREITRPPNGTMEYPASVIRQSAALIAAVTPPLPRQADWKAFAEQLAGASGASNSQGTRHYPYGDYSTHYATPSGGSASNSDSDSKFESGPDSWMQGIKIWSSRTYSSECVNDEGQRSWHMASGTLTSYISGGEYLGVFPVWNWTSLPGLTAVQGVHQNPCSAVKQLGSNDAAGGAALGPAGGVTMYDFVSGNFASDSSEYSKLTARKAYAHLPGLGTVVMIADLNQGPDKSGKKPWVTTTLEQSLLHGDVVVGLGDGTEQVLPLGEHAVEAASWVWHAGIGYISLE